MPERVRVCPRDGEPVVFTFEFPGVEYYCVVCGWKGGVFEGRQADATPELVAQAEAVHEQYLIERNERTGRPAPAPKPEGPRPTCGGCGKTAEGPMDGDKPRHWYSRTHEGIKQYACCRECITGGTVLPW